MHDRTPTHTRREFLGMLALAGGALGAGLPGMLPADGQRRPPLVRTSSTPETDWAWLQGNWSVEHRRLRERLAGSHDWDRFAGRSHLWLTMGGLGTVDDNLLELPSGLYRAAGVRAYDPATSRWAIWWLDGRNPASLGEPVMGCFSGDTGTFVGDHELRGRLVKARFRWRDIHSARPAWEQAFSPDGGASWEVNWENWFTRDSAVATPVPRRAGEPAAPTDFDFLVGRWAVRHRRLKKRLAGSNDWGEFGGSFVNWPLMGGQANVGDNLMDLPAGAYRGTGFRAFDPVSRQWSSWWIDGRDPLRISAPLRGGFESGVGTFVGDDVHEGRPIRARAQWSRITPTSARWEQSFSADGGATWEVNWTSDFTRTA